MTPDTKETYLADPNLTIAADVAMHLNQPLLLTGKPGTGKTQFALYLARKLGLGKPLRFDTKSTSQAKDLFYQFDSLARFHAAQLQLPDKDNLSFITFHALGLAFLHSQDPDTVRPLLRGQLHVEKRRSVVLIDEIDKAPRDFPNDLLNELDEKYFVIPELEGRRVDANTDPAFAPIVILTSNDEKNLPDAFLRRCVFYNIPYPDRARMKRILAANDTAEGALLESALDFFYEVRALSKLHKVPATAEFLDWMKTLRYRGAAPDRRLESIREFVQGTLGVLAKNENDQERVHKLAEEKLGKLPADAHY